MKEKILSASSPLGIPVSLYKNSWNGGLSDETLSVTGGFHGNQLNGFYIAARLTHFLQTVVEGTQNDYRLCGKVQIFPVINTQAAQAGSLNWSFDGLDMDLAFPGNESGEISERLSDAILEHTSNSTLGMILSSADNHYEDFTHIKLFNPDRSLKKTARFMGIEIAREISDLPKTHLFHHWVEHDIPSIMVTGGKTDSLDTDYCEKIIQGIINMMLATGLMAHPRKKPEPTPMTFYTSKNETSLVATQAGFFVKEVQTGEFLKSGNKLGTIIDMYSGETLEEIFVPNERLLVTLRDYPLVYEKETLAVLLNKKETSKFWPF